MGSDTTPLAGVTLESWARWLAEGLARFDEPVVLVGHSRGGIVVSQAAEFAPERVRGLVYLAAFLVPDGQTLFGTSAGVPRASNPNVVQMATDGTATVRRDSVGPNFYNTTPPDLVARAVDLMTPEPMRVFNEPLRLTAERLGRIPHAYIETTEDHAVPLELQRYMQAQLPCEPVFTLEGDHSPFYSAPEDLAAVLDSIARLDAAAEPAATSFNVPAAARARAHR
jgi:pimeloyl-ACP methyl ester carboxylesterase